MTPPEERVVLDLQAREDTHPRKGVMSQSDLFYLILSNPIRSRLVRWLISSYLILSHHVTTEHSPMFYHILLKPTYSRYGQVVVNKCLPYSGLCTFSVVYKERL